MSTRINDIYLDTWGTVSNPKVQHFAYTAETVQNKLANTTILKDYSPTQTVIEFDLVVFESKMHMFRELIVQLYGAIRNGFVRLFVPRVYEPYGEMFMRAYYDGALGSNIFPETRTIHFRFVTFSHLEAEARTFYNELPGNITPAFMGVSEDFPSPYNTLTSKDDFSYRLENYVYAYVLFRIYTQQEDIVRILYRIEIFPEDGITWDTATITITGLYYDDRTQNARLTAYGEVMDGYIGILQPTIITIEDATIRENKSNLDSTYAELCVLSGNDLSVVSEQIPMPVNIDIVLREVYV